MNADREPEWVVDCSIVIAWCFEDERDANAEAALDRLDFFPAIALALWRLEAVNALLVAERRRRITIAKIQREIRILEILPIHEDSGSFKRSFGAVLDLARAHNLSAYDAAYLELAFRLELPLATLDRKLIAAAKSAGVPLLAKD